ncbi:MAG: hypothetical protein ABGX22_10015 [Pirellulaceae bacterium]
MLAINSCDAVVATATAGHEAKVSCLAGELEVELNDRVVEGGIFEEDSFGFRWIYIRP